MDPGKWDITVLYRVTRYPRVFRRLTVGQPSLEFWGITTLFGFEENVMDYCIYQKVNGSMICFLVLYVDDILLALNNKGYYER